MILTVWLIFRDISEIFQKIFKRIIERINLIEIKIIRFIITKYFRFT